MKKQFISISSLPVETDGKRLIIENNKVLLEIKGKIVKQCSCRAGDKIEYTGDTFFIIKGPKEHWKKRLWDMGLTKGNWRHPNMMKDKDIIGSISSTDDTLKYSINVWKTKEEYTFWYAKCKTTPTDVLEVLSKDIVHQMKLLK